MHLGGKVGEIRLTPIPKGNPGTQLFILIALSVSFAPAWGRAATLGAGLPPWKHPALCLTNAFGLAPSVSGGINQHGGVFFCTRESLATPQERAHPLRVPPVLGPGGRGS